MDKEELERQLAIMNGEIEPDINGELDELMNILNSSDEDILNLDSIYSKETEEFNGLSEEDLNLLSENEEKKFKLTNEELEELLNSYKEEKREEENILSQIGDALNSIIEEDKKEEENILSQDALDSLIEEDKKEEENILSQDALDSLIEEDKKEEENILSQDALDSLIEEDKKEEENILSQDALDSLIEEDKKEEENILSQDALDSLIEEDKKEEKNILSQDALDSLIEEDKKEEENILSQDALDSLIEEDKKEEENILSQDALDSLIEEDKKEEKNLEKEDSMEIKEDINNTQENIEEETMGMEEFMKFVAESKDRNSHSDTKSKKTTIIMLSTIIVLIILIILTIIFFTISISKINKINTEKAIENDNNVAKYIPEDENTVYLDMAREIDGESIVLEKIHLNLEELTLYFNNNINTKKYNIVLTDSSSNLYPMDIDFTRNGFEENSTILRFKAIKENVEGLVLKFESLETGDKMEFNLNFDAKIIPKEVKYINSQVVNKFDGFNININNAIFTDSSSKIDYSIEPNQNSSYKIQLGSATQKDYIKLKQDGVEIGPLGYKPVSSFIDKNLLGSMEFKNVPNQNGNIILEFNNIYKRYDINKILAQSDINSGNIVYDFDNYKIFIEGIKLFGDKYVLVAHAEDKNIPIGNRSENVTHVELSLNVELIAQNVDGSEIIIAPTEVKSAKIGTDMIFELDESQMAGLYGKDVKVNIKSALIKLKPIQIPLSLERGMDRPIIGHQIMQEQITNAFSSRMAYKLEGKDISKIEGFSKQVLDNKNTMNEYAPMGKMKNPKYDLQFISTNLNQDNLEAIVQEVYQYELDSQVKTFYVKHKIKANYVEGNWTITYDEIIR